MRNPVQTRVIAQRVQLVVVLLALPIWIAAALPRPSGYVIDFAGVLDASARDELMSIARDLERQTTAEMAIATVSSLDGMSVEEYANRLFHDWGIGKKAADNGVLVLVAPSERKMRIEV